MIETWLNDDTQTLVFLGFVGEGKAVTVFVPLADFGLSAKSLQSYRAKIIVKRPDGAVIPIAIPTEEHDSRPWGRFCVPGCITKNSGIYQFQFRAVNPCYRLLTGAVFRGVVFEQV